jgi:hypothetical protein
MAVNVRKLVQHRAGNRCEYCLLPQEVDEWPFHVEHVIARQHGGSGEIDNLCWACSRYNLHKGPNIASLDPLTGKVVSLFHPRTQKWNRHFAIDKARIIGRTSAGRATARLLHMNDERRVDLRQDLIERGIYSK